MSHSTQAAIAGARGAEARAHQRCTEAIARLDAVRTPSEFAAVTAWAKGFDWFFRTSTDDAALRAAFAAARSRAIAHREPVPCEVPMSSVVDRTEIYGKRRYPAVLVKDGRKVSDTEFVDWFEDDAAAEAGYRAIMAIQGYQVLSVRIGAVTEVEIA